MRFSMDFAVLFSAAAIVLARAKVAVHHKHHNQGPSVKEKMPWYHSGDEIHSMIQELSQACPGVDIQLTQRSQLNLDGAGDVSLDVVKVKKSGASPQTKAFFVFGEHARELITGESALNFMQTLCGQTSESKRATKVLDDVEFTIVPNANPLSRKLVEAGQYCKRTNEDGVDLNRNWSDEHRDASQNVPDDEMNPGPNAFSEPETMLLKSLLDEEKPDIYLSIHSGAYLLGTPLGYTPSTQSVKNQAQMEEVLRPISETYCHGECPYGNLAQLIGYKSVGCDIDYVSEKLGVPFVYTWEIYTGSDIRTKYIDEAKERGGGGGMSEETMEFIQASDQNYVDRTQLNLVEKSSHLRRHSASARLKSHMRSKSKMRMPESWEGVDGCMDQFNPQTKEETLAVAQNWSGAYLMLCEQVVHKRKGGSSTTASAIANEAATAIDAGSPSTTTTMTTQSFSMAETPALDTSSEGISTAASDVQPSTTGQSTDSVFDGLSAEPAVSSSTPAPEASTSDSHEDFLLEARRLEKAAQEQKPSLEQFSSFLSPVIGQ